jgi:hypothetical protein
LNSKVQDSASLIKTFIAAVIVVFACNPGQQVNDNVLPEGNPQSAEILSAEVSGPEMNYTFNVEVKSPDTGCQQYADWWEVITPDTVLVYRRILAHSHVNEQPFKRSGGPVQITQGQEVIIRAHMNNLGYGHRVLRGSVVSGFRQVEIDAAFGLFLAQKEPLPGDCPN